MPYRKYWTTERRNLLKEVYETDISRNELLNLFPDISSHALNEAARRAGLKRPKDWRGRLRKGDLTPLLDETVEAYYWMGFIAADGCIKKNGHIVITCHEKDKNHLDKLAKFLKTENKIDGIYNINTTRYRVAVQDSIRGCEIAKKFDLKSNKTYDPPKTKLFKSWSDNLFIAWLIGFCDGDGYLLCKETPRSIYYCRMKLENHASWYEIHKYIVKFTKKYFKENTGKIHFSKRGYSNLLLSKYITSMLYLKAKELKLPYMERKWDKLIYFIKE